MFFIHNDKHLAKAWDHAPKCMGFVVVAQG
jgi:hypothetical protein